MWTQNYDPFSNPWLSTLTAATPVFLLFFLLACDLLILYRPRLVQMKPIEAVS